MIAFTSSVNSKVRSSEHALTVVNRTRQRLPLAFLRRAARIALTRLGITNYTVSVVLVGRQRSRTLNATFRKKDAATNVLSFPYVASHAGLTGDVVVCVPVAVAEAKKYSRSARMHLAMLTVHGIVHLAGYDHETSREARRMERLEAAIARKLGISE